MITDTVDMFENMIFFDFDKFSETFHLSYIIILRFLLDDFINYLINI